MNEGLGILKCYYLSSFSKLRHRAEISGVAVNGSKDIVFKYKKIVNTKNSETAEIRSLREIIEKIEALESREVLNSYTGIQIYGGLKSVVDEILTESFKRYGAGGAAENIAMLFQWHKDWKLIWDPSAEKIVNSYINKLIKNKPGIESPKPVNRRNKKKSQWNSISLKSLPDIDDMDLIFFDVEMNCNDGQVNTHCNHEIVSIGAIRYNTCFGIDMDNRFYSFVKPIENFILTEECKKITRIEQSQVDTAESFENVFKRFEQWVGDRENVFFISWGSDDIRAVLRDQLLNQSNLGIYNRMKNNYFNFQPEFSRHLNTDRVFSLTNALKLYSNEFRGEQHNALYDALNLAILYLRCKSTPDVIGNQI